MSSRRGDQPGSVLSFTYLDVLVCTMGSLVLLLVLFSERAKLAAAADAAKEAKRTTQSASDKPAEEIAQASPDDPEELARRLAELRKQQAELDRARDEAQRRLHDEQQRVSHLEDHQRRLEHELAKLHLTLRELEATENKQVVDQDQAEKELVRLRQLLQDTEARLAELRKETTNSRSFAIVPYKGPNGTFRRPIYVECTKDAIIIQPEGVRLIADDFMKPLGSGNPLAAALRAAQEDLNARAPAAQDVPPPDPYPLFIVRPDGIKAYEVALLATRTWDSDYGYEFVDADWKLTYPDADPRLAQIMAHAADLARERQRLLAAAAPRRYSERIGTSASAASRRADDGGSGFGGNGSVEQASGSNAGGSGYAGNSNQPRENAATEFGSASSPTGNDAAGGAHANGRRRQGGAPLGGEGNFADEVSPHGGQGGVSNGGEMRPAAGAVAGNETPGSISNSLGTNIAASGEAAPASGGAPANGFATSGSGYSASAGGGQSGQRAPASFDPHAAPNANSRTGQESVASGGQSIADRNAGGSTAASSDERAESAAKTRGANWANTAASRHAAPITRPIQLIISPDQLTLVDSNETPNLAVPQGRIVSFHQPSERVLDQLATAIQQQTSEWGLAGRGMYWRPTLVFRVAPGAERHALRLGELLQDSGVDVRLPQTAARPGEPSHATR